MRHSFNCHRVCYPPTWLTQGPNATPGWNPGPDLETSSPKSTPDSRLPRHITLHSRPTRRRCLSSPARRRGRIVLGHLHHYPQLGSVFHHPNGSLWHPQEVDRSKLRKLLDTKRGLTSGGDWRVDIKRGVFAHFDILLNWYKLMWYVANLLFEQISVWWRVDLWSVSTFTICKKEKNCVGGSPTATLRCLS